MFHVVAGLPETPATSLNTNVQPPASMLQKTGNGCVSANLIQYIPFFGSSHRWRKMSVHDSPGSFADPMKYLLHAYELSKTKHRRNDKIYRLHTIVCKVQLEKNLKIE